MRKTIIAVCMLVAAVAANAQIKVGPQVGLNLANMSTKYSDEAQDWMGDEPDTKMKLGMSLGLAVDFGFSDAISLKTGLLFSQKGYKIDEDGYTEKNTLNYFDIPVNVAFHIKDLQVFAGPTIGLGLSGKSKWEAGDESGDDKIKFVGKIDPEKDYGDDVDMLVKRLDLGLNIGAGYAFGPVVASLNYNFGLLNAMPKTDGLEDGEEDMADHITIKNRCLTIGVAYMFGGK